MTTRPAHPVIYEINTWVWLGELSRQYGRPIHLGVVPAREWDALADLGIDALWLMGVWERSPAGARIAMQNQGLVADFKGTLPDYSPADTIGSPYCVRRYIVDAHLGDLIHAPLHDVRNMPAPCDSCVNNSHCWGCRASAYHYGGDANGLDPKCWLIWPAGLPRQKH